MPKGVYDREKSAWKPWNKGKKLPPLTEEHKHNVSLALKGKKRKPRSDETKDKISVSVQEYWNNLSSDDDIVRNLKHSLTTLRNDYLKRSTRGEVAFKSFCRRLSIPWEALSYLPSSLEDSAEFRSIVDGEIQEANRERVMLGRREERDRIVFEKKEEKRRAKAEQVSLRYNLRAEARAKLVQERRALRLAIALDRKQRLFERIKRLNDPKCCPRCSEVLNEMRKNKFECLNDECELIEVLFSKTVGFYKHSIAAAITIGEEDENY